MKNVPEEEYFYFDYRLNMLRITPIDELQKYIARTRIKIHNYFKTKFEAYEAIFNILSILSNNNKLELKENETYWFLNDNLDPIFGYYLMSDNDKELLGIRNAFKTKEKALLYKKIIKEHLKYYYELRNSKKKE